MGCGYKLLASPNRTLHPSGCKVVQTTNPWPRHNKRTSKLSDFLLNTPPKCTTEAYKEPTWAAEGLLAHVTPPPQMQPYQLMH
jgi:hypothetical protein